MTTTPFSPPGNPFSKDGGGAGSSASSLRVDSQATSKIPGAFATSPVPDLKHSTATGTPHAAAGGVPARPGIGAGISSSSPFSRIASPLAKTANHPPSSAVTPLRSSGAPASAWPTPGPRPSAFLREQPTSAGASLFPSPPTSVQAQKPEMTKMSTSPFRKDIGVSDEEFIQLRDFIYQQCGIFIAENRKYLIENRLSSRIKELNLKTYSEYYNFLRFDVSRKIELNKLFEVVTTNETSFYRNPPQLEVFQNIVLTDILEKCRKAGHKRLRLWSAGCSTGEEPYTLAIILHELLKGELASWDIKITANDLSEAVLNAARRGIYSDYALRTTPPGIISSYFTKEGNVYKIDESLKRIVSFGQINLNDREQLKRVEKSQIVFCRNVIIYFDDDMKRRVINAYYDNLEPDGVLLIGHSESLHNITRAFQLEQHKGTIVYRKKI
jgi:chemotaxis protein methyltransferase CheR